jgi:hypothetical protein
MLTVAGFELLVVVEELEGVAAAGGALCLDDAELVPPHARSTSTKPGPMSIAGRDQLGICIDRGSRIMPGRASAGVQ